MRVRFDNGQGFWYKYDCMEDALSPLDGRYNNQTRDLSPFFSEFALTTYRISIEIRYLIFLSELHIISLTSKEKQKIKEIATRFSKKEYARIKTTEKKVNHDIKAIEYFLQGRLEDMGISSVVSFIHFGLTSEDVNNLSYSLMLKESKEKVMEIAISNLIESLVQVSSNSIDIPILARTHGQPATPTIFGKEMANYIYRLKKQYDKIQRHHFDGKLNGAVGNYNALHFAFPHINWVTHVSNFISKLGLIPHPSTTQILPYDSHLEYFQHLQLLNGILLDLSLNIWNYVMLGILKQKNENREVGSSTMPQKINPIDFENAEGNLILAQGMIEVMVRKLATSRLSRDLSDSTVRRSYGVMCGYSLVAYKSIIRGLGKISVDKESAAFELNNHWEVLSEPVQTYLRMKNNSKAYEILKKQARGKIWDKKAYYALLEGMGLEKNEHLTRLSPLIYLGLSKKLAKSILKRGEKVNSLSIL